MGSRTDELVIAARLAGWRCGVFGDEQDNPHVEQTLKAAWYCGWKRGYRARERMKKNRVHAI